MRTSFCTFCLLMGLLTGILQAQAQGDFEDLPRGTVKMVLPIDQELDPVSRAEKKVAAPTTQETV
ncbi:MAG TPA: hypothetical protein VIT68_03105, partial [Candidatus Gracilibacteria bacterium]